MRSCVLRTRSSCLGAPALPARLPSENSPAIPSFAEETATSGIDSIYAGDWQYMVGGGAAIFDCNGDGYADMLLAGGEKPAKFYRNASQRGGALKFTAETNGLELPGMTAAPIRWTSTAMATQISFCCASARMS